MVYGQFGDRDGNQKDYVYSCFVVVRFFGFQVGYICVQILDCSGIFICDIRCVSIIW